MEERNELKGLDKGTTIPIIIISNILMKIFKDYDWWAPKLREKSNTYNYSKLSYRGFKHKL